MDFLPQVSPENLDEGNLQCWNLAMHKYSCEVKLNLETHINLERRENAEYHETTTSVIFLCGCTYESQ